MIYKGDELLIIGNGDRSTTCQDVQYLNLAANLTGVYAGTIDCGKYDNGYAYIGIYDFVGGDVSIFGGYEAGESCIQQTGFGDNIGVQWTCVPSSKSAFEGLQYFHDRSRTVNFGIVSFIRYSNFVL